MNLNPETRATLTFLTGLGILCSQAYVGIGTNHKPSELLIGAGLLIVAPEAVQIVKGLFGNGGGK